MANPNEEYRKLTKLGKGSYYVLIPPAIVRVLGWKERRKLLVERRGKMVVIKDWNGRREGRHG